MPIGNYRAKELLELGDSVSDPQLLSHSNESMLPPGIVQLHVNTTDGRTGTSPDGPHLHTQITLVA